MMSESTERNTSTHAVAVLERPVRPASVHRTLDILIVDDNCDCTDALENLLAEMPGVGSVTIAASASSAIAELDAARATRSPDVIFIDPQPRVDRIASTQATLRALRCRIPSAAIVLLNVYPGAITRSLRGLVDYSIRKDTSHRELRALIDEIAGKTEMVGVCQAAG